MPFSNSMPPNIFVIYPKHFQESSSHWSGCSASRWGSVPASSPGLDRVFNLIPWIHTHPSNEGILSWAVAPSSYLNFQKTLPLLLLTFKMISFPISTSQLSKVCSSTLQEYSHELLQVMTRFNLFFMQRQGHCRACHISPSKLDLQCC